jgi:di/tricarboxylate transporter
MKKTLFLPLGLALVLSVLFHVTYAQEDTMKMMEPIVIYAKSNVNKTVTDAFEKKFKDAMDPQWYRMNKKLPGYIYYR